MKFLRTVVGQVIVFLDKAFSPKSLSRSAAEQQKADEAAAAYTLYQFEACPFCIKVRRNLKRLNIKVNTLDVLNDKQAENDLIAGGGKRQVPCLKIKNPDGAVQWMYESGDINAHLNLRFAP